MRQQKPVRLSIHFPFFFTRKGEIEKPGLFLLFIQDVSSACFTASCGLSTEKCLPETLHATVKEFSLLSTNARL